jgi:tRNA(fMet)-specific endonuclease VapC
VKYLLDSNILILVGEAQHEPLRRRMAEVDEDAMVTSAVAYAEVLHGSTRGKPPPLDALARLVARIPVLPFDDAAAAAYARLPFERGSYDRLIGAHALALNLIMVTNNVDHYVRIPGLTVEDWTVL